MSLSKQARPSQDKSPCTMLYVGLRPGRTFMPEVKDLDVSDVGFSVVQSPLGDK